MVAENGTTIRRHRRSKRPWIEGRESARDYRGSFSRYVIPLTRLRCHGWRSDDHRRSPCTDRILRNHVRFSFRWWVDAHRVYFREDNGPICAATAATATDHGTEIPRYPEQRGEEGASFTGSGEFFRISGRGPGVCACASTS